ncbi:MAG: CapA family protein [Candidatus Woesearchaeota archaeon]
MSTYVAIQKEKQENDLVIVVYHGGLEYQYYPTPEMVKNFKFMVDAGADTVVSHHTHRYSGSMVYNGKPILFGLGNFLSPTKSKVTEDWLTGIIAKIKFDKNSIDFELTPTKMSADYSQVGLANKTKSAEVFEHINNLSLVISDENEFNKYWFNQDNKAKFIIFKLLKSNSPLEYKLRKHFSFLFKPHLSRYKNKLLLNMLRCDSHRERLIRILENHK